MQETQKCVYRKGKGTVIHFFGVNIGLQNRDSQHAKSIHRKTAACTHTNLGARFLGVEVLRGRSALDVLGGHGGGSNDLDGLVSGSVATGHVVIYDRRM
jgi:hypothetical protein